MIYKLVYNLFKTNISSTQYKLTSKLSQNLKKFTNFLIQKIQNISEKSTENYPNMLLRMFNAILTALLESKTAIFPDFPEIFENGLNIIILMIKQHELQKDRAFNNIKNILIFNYFVILQNDESINNIDLFKETLENLFSDIFDICDQCNIDSYAVLFRFLEYLYVPYILKKIDNDEGNSCIENLIKFMKVCRNNLVENCKWTFRYQEVSFLMGFMINESFFFNEKIVNSRLLNKFIMETWEVGSKYWLVQRAIVDQLFKIFYRFPEKMKDCTDIIIFLLKSKETRGFDSNLLFYLNEYYIPVLF